MFHGACLEALPKRLIQRDSLQVSSEDRAQMADFVLKNIFFLNSTSGSNDKKEKQLLVQNLSLLALASSHMKWRQSFLKARNYNLSFGSVINTIYFLFGEVKLTHFLNKLNNFHTNLKFTYEATSYTVNFLDLNVSLKNAIHADIYVKPVDGTNTSTINPSTPCTLRAQYKIVKH